MVETDENVTIEDDEATEEQKTMLSSMYRSRSSYNRWGWVFSIGGIGGPWEFFPHPSPRTGFPDSPLMTKFKNSNPWEDISSGKLIC